MFLVSLNYFRAVTILIIVAGHCYGLVGFDLTSKVKKGENIGRMFKHDFVVLGYRTIAMQPNRHGFIADAVELPTTLIHSQRSAIVTWVNTPTAPSPLQATGGWLN